MGRFANVWMPIYGLLTTVLATELIPPSQDPWYAAPPGFESKAPGTILRTRQAPPNITALANNSVEAHQLLFRSTDTLYRPSWAVTTVFLPTEESRAGRNKPALLSYQIPYNTLDVDQSPSYGLSTIYGENIMADVRQGLSQGWIVSVPDFEGPEAAFSAGPQAGHAVLDSVRAVLSFTNLTEPDSARYALWGYSGGAFASGFAGELQASYAPELDIAGIAIGEARQYLVDHLHKEGTHNATSFLSALHIPAAEAIALFSGQDIFGYFTNGDEIMRAPELARVFGNNWHESYHGIPQMPVYAYKAIHDENTNIRTTDEHVARICGVGANVLYDRNTVGGHEDEAISGGRRALKWLSDALDGRQLEPANGCKVQNVTVGVSL
ncbi:lipase 5 [Pyricularia oryzae 70-15]|uniref:Lipase 5 n=1 Tax=Pyricularia oryzae (strain 70-15 / ATCC MYA-4617 / FGSC 8958) TaxID=242507 RepID=G4NLA1_PYRO7|nr:lipase 5 [Pyricularia oryzae 70-15]EHA46746.1 lipase 5 [Pyricularia oryzae 70-15]